LFFLDSSGLHAQPDRTDARHRLSNGEKDHDYERPPAWVDSDDERVSVSLASNPRLRKLRDTESEDIINGREYIKRLRKQYERLHPTPDWVRQANVKSSHRQMCRRGSPHDSPEVSDSDMSIDDDFSTSSTQPLAELLRTAGSLTCADTT